MSNHSFKAEPNSLEIVSTYTFDAPRQKVYTAYTDAALVPKWWGVEGVTLRVQKMDVKPGGSWRFAMDNDYFRGVYHVAKAPELIISSWQYEPMPTVMFQTTTFEELPGGKTKVTEQAVFQSVKARDEMLKMGMEEGSVPMLERLSKLL